MSPWTLYITYSRKKYQLKAEIEYKSKQIIRIRVHGQRTTLLVENDYPAIYFTNSKKGVRWKIRQGQLGDAKLLMDIFIQLEHLMKKDIIEIYPNDSSPLF